MLKVRRSHRLLILIAGFGLYACSPDEPAPATPSVTAVEAAPLEPLPPLRTGVREPEVQPELNAQLGGRWADATHEYLELVLGVSEYAPGNSGSRVVIEAASDGLAVLEAVERGGAFHVLLRRPLAQADTALSAGRIYTRNWNSQKPWLQWPFKIGGSASAGTAELRTRWISAFAASHSESWGISAHPWAAFAAGRVQALETGLKAGAVLTGTEAPQRRGELSQLMDTTTGMMSVQEALQHDRGLRLADKAQPRDIDIAQLEAPPLAVHPFAEMQAKLAKPDGGVPEPMAAAVPADFWYLRVDDIRLLLTLLDEAEAWVTPVVQVLQRNPEDRQLADRYQAQLGLRRSGLAKVLGHTVVGPVAVVGSDPYLREGSDLTLLFKVKQQALFDHELAEHLAAYKQQFPDLAGSTREYAGVSIAVQQDSRGTVRQQRAQIGDLALVSNSPAALNRVIDAIQGTAPRLADEADLKYLLARDPGAHQAFAFLSDRFIATVVGPQQKIAAARRQLALAELLTPGYAALLHGWLYGEAPATTEALLERGLLASDELKHSDGTPIDYTPGQAARSSWGTVAALTPLIDLPRVDAISAAERDAYGNFVSSYQNYWRQFIDPVAVRIDLLEQPTSRTVKVDVRILPLISGTDYSEIAAVVGNARVRVPALSAGMESVWAVGSDARLRSELDGLLRSMVGQEDVGLGWLGNWVSWGLTDRAALLELYSRFDESTQLAWPQAGGNEFEDLDLWQRIGKFPVYGVAEVKNPVVLVATLTGVRAMLNQVAPGMVDWKEVGRYRELPIVRIGVNRSAPMLSNPALADAVGLHYVQTGSALVLALNPETLHGVIDRLLDGAAPVYAADAPAQFVFDARSRKGAPLWTALLWALQGQAYQTQESARRAAEYLLRGDPAAQAGPEAFAERAMATLGSVPVSVRGDHSFQLQPEGVSDAVAGSTIAPRFVDLPIPGSPVERLMQGLAGLRGEVSFDTEPEVAGQPARSLHTVFELQLRAP